MTAKLGIRSSGCRLQFRCAARVSELVRERWGGLEGGGSIVLMPMSAVPILLHVSFSYQQTPIFIDRQSTLVPQELKEQNSALVDQNALMQNELASIQSDRAFLDLTLKRRSRKDAR